MAPDSDQIRPVWIHVIDLPVCQLLPIDKGGIHGQIIMVLFQLTVAQADVLEHELNVLPSAKRVDFQTECGIHDIALERLHVVLGVDRAGLVGADGETHHGCFDVLFLSEIPGFTVLCPSDFAELRSMTRKALFEIEGPVAIRYPRGGEGAFRADTSGEPIVRLKEGGDVAILSYGILINEALKAAELLEAQGIRAEVIKLNQISPLDDGMLQGFFRETKTLLVLEDSFVAGCVGQRLAATLAKHGRCPRRLILKNLGKTFAPAGSVPELWKQFGLDAASVAAALMEVKDHGE